MAQKDLIPLNKRTKEEQKEITSKGGKASGVARRKKRDAKKAAQLILNLPCMEAQSKNLKQMGVDEEDLTNKVAVMARAFSKAMSGDVKAMEFLITMSGETPKQQLEEKKFDYEANQDNKTNDAVDDWVDAVISADKEIYDDEA